MINSCQVLLYPRVTASTQVDQNTTSSLQWKYTKWDMKFCGRFLGTVLSLSIEMSLGSVTIRVSKVCQNWQNLQNFLIIDKLQVFWISPWRFFVQIFKSLFIAIICLWVYIGNLTASQTLQDYNLIKCMKIFKKMFLF